MNALRFNAKYKKLQLSQVAIPIVKNVDDVLIKVAYAGICGTDLKILQGKFPCNPDVPVTLGHEFSGTVVKLGCNVKKLKKGDKVTVDPHHGCNRCHYCDLGYPNYCKDVVGIYKKAGFFKDGGFADYTLIPESQVYKLPESITLKQGILTEPLSCLAHAYDRISPILIGMKILVMGAGICGNLMACIFHRKGHRSVAVVDPNTEKLGLLKNLDTGFELMTPSELVVKHKTDPRYLFDVIVDCSGNPEAIELGIDLLQMGGKFCCFGVAPPQAEINVSPYDIFSKELKILGSLGNPFTFREALGMMESMGDRYLNYDTLGINMYDLGHYQTAIQCLKKGRVAKAVFQFL